MLKKKKYYTAEKFDNGETIGRSVFKRSLGWAALGLVIFLIALILKLLGLATFF